MRWLGRVGLSAFLLFHLATILIFPNPNSIPGRSLSRYLVDYANLFNFNITWQFFSPDPSGHHYLTYEVYQEVPGENAPIPEPQIWPPRREEGGLRDKWFRIIYHSRNMMVSPERMQNYLMPWLCRQHPGSREIHLKGVTEDIPTIELTQLQQKNFAEMAQPKDWTFMKFECEP